MMKFRITAYVLLVLLVVVPSCKCSRETNGEPKAEAAIAAEKLPEIKIERFEKDLFSMNIDSIDADLSKLKTKYGEFLNLYSHKIIQLGSPDAPGYGDLIKGFITDYFMNLDYLKVVEVYPNVADLEQELTQAFRRYLEYFPDKKIPRIYTCISGWNHSVFTSDSVIGIALDKYLGRNSEFYEKLGLDRYKRYTLQREYIVPDVMRSWAYTEFGFSDSAGNVLENMLYEGKVVYFIKQMSPEMEDSIAFGYTAKQMKWCESNGEQMWTYLAEHKLLFSTDYMVMRKLVYPAPFTAYFTPESPGRSAVWLGYKIIASYMKHNKSVTLDALMHNTDYEGILRESKFKPD